MGDAGYRGTSMDQDRRFKDKESVLLKKLKFPPEFDKRVDMRKVSMQVMRPWIVQKVVELLGFEDDVVVEYATGLLEDTENPTPDPRKMQINLTGFLESKTADFMLELWKLLLSAQESVGGIPAIFVEQKKAEMERKRAEDERVLAEVRRKEEAERAERGRGGDDRARDRYQGGRGPPPGKERGSRWDNGGGGSRGYGGGGGGRPPPPVFKDKRGNVTERAADSGWGARAKAPTRSPPPRERSPLPPRRRSPSPPPPRRRRTPSHSPPSVSPPPKRSRRSPSPYSRRESDRSVDRDRERRRERSRDYRGTGYDARPRRYNDAYDERSNRRCSRDYDYDQERRRNDRSRSRSIPRKHRGLYDSDDEDRRAPPTRTRRAEEDIGDSHRRSGRHEEDEPRRRDARYAARPREREGHSATPPVRAVEPEPDQDGAKQKAKYEGALAKSKWANEEDEGEGIKIKGASKGVGEDKNREEELREKLLLSQKARE